VLFILASGLFFGLHVQPKKPSHMMIGTDSDEEQRLSVGGRLTFNSDLAIDYFDWVKGVVHADVGYSDFYDRPALPVIVRRAGPTLLLAGLSVLIGLLIGLPAGVLAATRRGPALNRAVALFSSVGSATPVFWLALFLIYLFASYWDWLPDSGYVSPADGLADAARHLVLPCTALAIAIAAPIAALTRSIVRDALGQNVVRTARAKGLPEHLVVVRHGLRCVLAPLAATTGLILVSMFGAVVVVEQVFNIPGLGKLLIQSINRRDFPMIQSLVLFFGFVSILIVFGADVVKAAVDSRLRPRDTHGFVKLVPSVTTKPDSAQQSNRSMSRRLIFGIAVFAAWSVMLLIAPAHTGHEIEVQAATQRLKPPDRVFLLGTDDVGRDLLTWVLAGARNSLLVGYVVTGIAIVTGTAIGLSVGLWRRLRQPIMRFLDALSAVPMLILALSVLTVWGGSQRSLIIVLVVCSWPIIVRSVRTNVETLQATQLCEAARVVGYSQRRLILRIILPSALRCSLGLFATIFSGAILTEAAISFLGVRSSSGAASWGATINDAQPFMREAPWTLIAPAVAMIGTLLLLNLIGSRLRLPVDSETARLLPNKTTTNHSRRRLISESLAVLDAVV